MNSVRFPEGSLRPGWWRGAQAMNDLSSEAGERIENQAGESAAFGPFRLFPAARRLELEGEPVEIGDRALEVLIELVKHAGRVVSKADLMATIWAETAVVEGVVRTHVYHLRRALGGGEAGARYVACVSGRGYSFVAPVVRSTLFTVGNRAATLP